MTNFDKFQRAFDAHVETLDDGIYELLEYGGELPFGGEIVVDEREDISDSYGWTDDLLTKVIYFSDFEVYVQFKGREASYNGLEWDDEYKEVFPNTKTVTTYE